MSSGGVVGDYQMSKTVALAEERLRAARTLGGRIATAGKVVGIFGVILSGVQLLQAGSAYSRGDTPHGGDVLGGTADLLVGLGGLSSNPIGGAFAAGYFIGSFAVAPILDKFGHFSRVTKRARLAERWVSAKSGSTTIGTIAGAYVAFCRFGVRVTGCRAPLASSS
jgi:hypothetical protein